MRPRRDIVVFAYRNLHTGGYSARQHPGGKVLAHADSIMLEDARFAVSEAGRQRVISERRRNVHAGVVGRLVVDPRRAAELLKKDRIRVDYNPYRGSAFMSESGDEVSSSASVLLEKGCAWCEAPKESSDARA